MSMARTPNTEDSRGGTVLYETVSLLSACLNPDEIEYEFVRLLLEHGADPNIKDSRGDNCMACVCGGDIFSISHVDLRLMKMLVAHGAEVNSLNAEGRTPLTSCIESAGFDNEDCNLEALKFLVESGADVNMKDGRGITPLMCDIRPDCDYGDEMTEYLAAHGAKE